MLIYLIDEDPISLFLTEHVLRAEEFAQDIHPFTAAEEALAYLVPRLATAVPQIILLDLNMPVMDGWGFLAALTPYEAALQSRCRIYLLTSSLALADRVKSQNYALVAGVIRKPLEEEEVKTMLAVIQGNAGKDDSKPEA
jgi:CheY-like chemotaxis protein